MAFPEEVTTRQVRVPGAVENPSAAGLRMEVYVTPSLNLTWTGGGEATQVRARKFAFGGNAGEPVLVPLIPTDLSGWRKDDGSLIVVGAGQYSHTYDLTFKFFAGEKELAALARDVKGLVVPSGEDPVDLAELLEVASSEGGTVLIPDLWTQIVTDAEAAAQAAADAVIDSATFVDGRVKRGQANGTASLDSSSKVPAAQLPFGASDFATAAQGSKADTAVQDTPAGRLALAESTEVSTAIGGAVQAATVDMDTQTIATARALMNGEAAIDIARMQSLFLGPADGLFVQALKPSANATATTLAAASSIGATSLSVAGRLTPGRYVVDSETVTVTGISGSGPYAVTLAAPATAAHASGAAIATVELDYKLIRGLGGGRFGVRELTWKTNNPPNTPFYSNGLNQLGKCYLAVPMTSVGRDDASITRTGTFSTGTQAAAYGGGYRFSTATNAQVARSTVAGATAAGMHFTIAADGSLWKVSIDGDPTRARLLKTAQQVVDDGIFPASILAANGGPFNPTDRVVSCFQNRSIIYDNLVAFADDLTPGVHAITLNGYGVEPIYTAVQAAYTAGATKLRTTNQLVAGVTYRIGSETFTVTGTSTTVSTGVYESTLTAALTGSYAVGVSVLRTAPRVYYSGLSDGVPGTLPTGAGVEMFTTHSIHDEASTASAWEYADNERPLAGGTLTFIGSIHGYERQDSLTVYNGNTVVAMTAGQTLAAGTGGRFRFVRTSTLFHPDAGAGTTPTKTSTVEYIHDRQDLLVTSTIAYLMAMLADLMYLMMPGNGCLSKTGVPMDRVGLSSFPGSLTFTGGSDSRYGHSRSAASWMWSSTGKVGQLVYMPDVFGTLSGWAYSGKTLHQVQDRAGSLTKIYIPSNGAGSEQREIPAGTVITRSARYLLGYFSGGAEASLAAA